MSNAIETGPHRFARIKRIDFNRDGPISFNMQTTNEGYLFNTEQYYQHDLIEYQCYTFSQLFIYLFSEYPSFLKKYKSVPTPPHNKPGKKHYFLVLPDNNPQTGQDPFLIVEYLNYDTKDETRKCYHTIGHFVRDVVLKQK